MIKPSLSVCRSAISLLALLGASTFLVACGGGGGGGVVVPVPALGEPRLGLTTDELAAFDRGKAVFERRFTQSTGLGPFYNATSCVSCHSTPVTGGSAQLYRNFFLVRFGDPTIQGGQADFPNLTSGVLPAFGPGVAHILADFSLDAARHPFPDLGPGGQPVQAAHRNGLPVFGVGLFEAIAESTILGLTDPNDSNADGISGRFNRDAGIVSRFGVKSQSADIVRFTRAPLLNQMGITTDPLVTTNLILPMQVSTDPGAPTIDHDSIPDPEMSNQDLADLVAFMRFLAPPAPRPMGTEATAGRALFTTLGCALCHIPSLPSSLGPVDAFTDLLLHDMGPDLADGIAMGVPQASTIDGLTTHREFRTQPLWGVSFSAPFLHDGRAETLEEAILMHGGEAEVSRNAFAALSPADRARVIAFLETL